MQDNSSYYTESEEIKSIATKLRGEYIEVVGHVDLSKIFFAFKAADDTLFQYEILGLKNPWVKYSLGSSGELKVYCLAMSYDFYQNSQPALLEWIIWECLYSCDEEMNGKIRRKDVSEFSRFMSTLEDLGYSYSWREHKELPPLLGPEKIMFAAEESD